MRPHVLSIVDDNPFHAPDPYRLAPRRRRFIVQVFLLLALGFIAYWPAHAAGPLWQDVGRVTANVSIRTWAGVGRLWAHPKAQSIYCPLANSLLCAEHRLWTAELPRYRLITLLLHGLNCVLIWKILRRLELPGAWLAAALFAVHPVNVQAVAWVNRQGLVLATTLSAGAMLAYLRLRDVAPPP